ncbi:hypothetical protein XELAEV_18008895mg [Xenopus laevis]|uniref:Uncharacterized protein n=1 Tax=Xenopus laevis TaxID=8355 RepID=A0A974DRD4_XENLA|nr:hypothetical protein XELAEV_18008895mg [Xenopus laevis]
MVLSPPAASVSHRRFLSINFFTLPTDLLYSDMFPLNDPPAESEVYKEIRKGWTWMENVKRQNVGGELEQSSMMFYFVLLAMHKHRCGYSACCPVTQSFHHHLKSFGRYNFTLGSQGCKLSFI